jgi:hypothetical protein
MKITRLILSTLVLSLSFTTCALAASTKVPPASVCLTDENGSSFPLTIKLAGKIKTAGGRVKFYNINGEYLAPIQSIRIPLVGTGHVLGNEFHFSITGTTRWVDGIFYTVLAEGFWNLANSTNPVGTLNLRWVTNQSATTSGNSYTLSLTDCSTVVLY